MMRLPRSRFWVRAVFLLSLGLTTHLATPARAGLDGLPPVPAGTQRVFQLGPQEWVSVDGHGHVSHVETPTEALTPAKRLSAIVSVWGTAVLGVFAGQNGPYFTRESPAVQRR